jgi:8-amino-7-oxononanoate synthase
MREALRKETDSLKEKALFRFLRVASCAGRETVLDGKKVLNFASNDYLGLACDSRLVDAAKSVMDRSGFGSGASRLVSGNSMEHVCLEEELARFKGVEAALVFSSGYMANVGAISSLVGRNDVVFSDRLNHASIVDGIVLSRARMVRYAHNDADALEESLCRENGAGRKLIVTDTVFSMDGDAAPLERIVSLAKKHHAWLMVDEAHAFGVLGARGSGLCEELGLTDQVDVHMGTLSKAAGSMGAYVAGSRELVDYLVNSARSFVFTTAMPPSNAAASRAALRVIESEPGRRDRLKVAATTLRRELQRMGFETGDGASPIIPVMAGEAVRAVSWSQALLEQGVFAPAVRPPTVPEGSARLRVTVTAAHTDEDIAKCVQAFAGVHR